MKVIEQVYREMLYQALEKKRLTQTQLELSRTLRISISVISYSLQPLRDMGAISVAPRNFRITDLEKILYHWANIRNLKKDIIYSTRTEMSVQDIEKNMPPNVTYAAYSAYKFAFGTPPADYSEVYVYSESIKEIKKRFLQSKNTPNIFILKADKNLKRYGATTTVGQTFADLWNIKEWYAKDFLKGIKSVIETSYPAVFR